MSLYTDDEARRGAEAMAATFTNRVYNGDLAWEAGTKAVLDATLPAIRKRWLNELADEMQNGSGDVMFHVWDLRRKADEVTP